MDPNKLGPYLINRVAHGNCADLGADLPDESVDVLVTSPPYWGQRTSAGMGAEEDPREYVRRLVEIFRVLKPKVKRDGIVWLNIGDAYNTPVNWRPGDRGYSSLGPGGTGLDGNNSAYIKPRARRKAYLRAEPPWLSYGNLLALPYRVVIGMCDDGWLFRGEVIWRKKNPLPEGRCRRPHRAHESVFLFARSEKHAFLTDPPVKSVREFPNERMTGPAHYSRFPLELPAAAYPPSGAAARTSWCSILSQAAAPPDSPPSRSVAPTSASRLTPCRSPPRTPGLRSPRDRRPGVGTRVPGAAAGGICRIGGSGGYYPG